MTLSRRLEHRLGRRAVLRRLGAGGAGAIALALVGCADDEPSQPLSQSQPQSESAAQSDPLPESDQQQSASPALQPGDQDVEQQRVEQQAQPRESRQQGQPAAAAAQTRRQSAQPQQARQVQQAEQSQTQPLAERRLLVPDVVPGDNEHQDPAFEPVAGARVDFGEIDGAGYRVELPQQWNGELVLWAHGFRGLNDEGTGYSDRMTFDEIPARDVIIGQGYGWATSTYRVNGYVPGVGVDDLLRVKDRVSEIARAPSRTYIAGGSMGGATAQLMAQEFPQEIAAALAFCPAMGNIWVVDYLVAWHALAHYLIGAPPEQMDVSGLIEWSAALGVSDSTGLHLSATGEQFAALIKDFTGGDRWGFEEGLRQQWNISFALGAVLWPDIVASAPLSPGQVIAVSNTQPPADTRQHVYSAGPDAGIDLDRLNAEVIRAASSDERRRDPGIGLPSGELKVPTLSMMTTGDLFTPIHLVRDYQRLVTDAGYAQNLVVQPVRRAGHCTFSDSESLGAFTSIVAWLGFGLAPPGDDLQGDLSVIGARFTNPFDQDDPLSPRT